VTSMRYREVDAVLQQCPVKLGGRLGPAQRDRDRGRGGGDSSGAAVILRGPDGVGHFGATAWMNDVAVLDAVPGYRGPAATAAAALAAADCHLGAVGNGRLGPGQPDRGRSHRAGGVQGADRPGGGDVRCPATYKVAIYPGRPARRTRLRSRPDRSRRRARPSGSAKRFGAGLPAGGHRRPPPDLPNCRATRARTAPAKTTLTPRGCRSRTEQVDRAYGARGRRRAHKRVLTLDEAAVRG
jgi:hypothetical protein